MTTQNLVDDFYQFACAQLDGGAEMSLDELYLVWRARRPNAEELSDCAAAVNAAYADFQAGDRGEPARQCLDDICRELGLVISE